ncbi:MAG: hypothetical protein QOF60_2190 [Actinomycetota bacterium]|jgi:DUF4097 and DUF4098 domain-containing protein YvlB|nr:hypothetical protein [Actinomycetota bacterium]
MARWDGAELDLTIGDVERLDVQIVGGEVTVSGGAGPARVEVEVLQGPDAEVSISGGVLRVVHEPERTLLGIVRGNVKAIVTVVVPEATATAVRTVSGDAFVAGIAAACSITTVSGRLTATGLDGEVRLKTVSGAIEVQGLSGTLDTNTVSGEVVVAGAEPSSVVSRSVSGGVTLDLRNAADVSCTTVSGEVAVRLPADAGADLDVSTVSGSLDVAFPTDDLEIGKRRIRGRIGGGGPVVSVRTTSGNVALLRRTSAAAPEPAR